MLSKPASLHRRSFLVSTALIGSGLVLAGSMPALAARNTIRFFVLGDWGTKGGSGQRKVAAAMMETAKVTPPDFVISVGDNFYPDGVDSISDDHWMKSFEQIYNSPELQCLWYSVLGNHDRRGNIVAATRFHSVDSRWNMPSPFYNHTERLTETDIAEFFFLDTTPLQDTDWIAGSLDSQLKWFETQLKNSTAKWKIAVGHHPVYSSGYHGGIKAFADRVQPLLESYGVQAYFCGHEHHLEHVKKYGIDYFVTGSGARTRPVESEEVWSNGSDFAASELGFAVGAIETDEMVVEYMSATATSLFRTAVSPAR